MIPVRKDKVSKYCMCKKCLVKNHMHTMAKCKAKNCNICGGEHSYLLCDEEGGQQKMFSTTEEGGDGGDDLDETLERVKQPKMGYDKS